MNINTLFRGVAILATLAFAALPACVRKPDPAAAAAALTDHGPLGPFTLTTQHGTPAGPATLADKVWLLNFIFTRCMGPCPLMSGHMKTLQTHFAADPQVGFVSVTTDPTHDTPAVLAAYGARFAAGERWLFLTGDKAEVIRLSRDVLKLPAGEAPDMHSPRFVLIDAAGHVRGWYDSTDPDFQTRVRGDAAALAQAARAAAH